MNISVIKTITNRRTVKIWLTLTIVYALFVLGYEGLLPGNLPGAILGMFVPVFIWITIGSYGIAIVIALLVMIKLDIFFKQTNIILLKKRLVQDIATLLVLFVMVMIFDFAVFQEFPSLDILLYELGIGEEPYYCC